MQPCSSRSPPRSGFAESSAGGVVAQPASRRVRARNMRRFMGWGEGRGRGVPLRSFRASEDAVHNSSVEDCPPSHLYSDGRRPAEALSKAKSEGWRRGGDSNPRDPFRSTRFPSARTRPLCDLSTVATVATEDRQMEEEFTGKPLSW